MNHFSRPYGTEQIMGDSEPGNELPGYFQLSLTGQKQTLRKTHCPAL